MRLGFRLLALLLYLPLILNDSIPEEHKSGIDIGRDLLRRSHVLVVCGDGVNEDMKNDIATAGRLNITATHDGRHSDGQGTGPHGGRNQ